MERLKKKPFGFVFQLCFLCLISTIISTIVGTVFLLAGIFSEGWEMMVYNTTILEEMKLWKNISDDIEARDLAFDGKVARIAQIIRRHKANQSHLRIRVLPNEYPKKSYPVYTRMPIRQISQTRWRRRKRQILSTVVYLVPIKGGMFKYCIDLEDKYLIALQSMGFFQDSCSYYLKHFEEEEDDLTMRPSHYVQKEVASMRIHNLALSCSLVCTIVLCSAAILGAFGVTRRQLSAVLITGVMYMLAAVFGLFALCMMYFKRRTSKDYILYNDTLPRDSPYIMARSFTTGYSVHLSMTGVIFTAIGAIFWIILAKIMRYNFHY